MEEIPRADGIAVEPDVIEDLAQSLYGLIPLLRCMNAADDTSWMRLHVRIMELGGLVPNEVSVLQQLVNGLSPDDAGK
jgi:hypothetical protein